tara:strand:- start:3086 stop:3253 length:168 start_codon:yes stop_codon:yes gene_type:complete
LDRFLLAVKAVKLKDKWQQKTKNNDILGGFSYKSFRDQNIIEIKMNGKNFGLKVR